MEGRREGGALEGMKEQGKDGGREVRRKGWKGERDGKLEGRSKGGVGGGRTEQRRSVCGWVDLEKCKPPSAGSILLHEMFRFARLELSMPFKIH